MSTLHITQLFGVKGYVAVVTGGSSGLGFMISKVGVLGVTPMLLIRCRLTRT